MKNDKRLTKCLVVLGCLLLILGSYPASYGNSAEPPSIVIIVPHAPKELTVSLNNDGSLVEGRAERKLIETHYLFYHRDFKENQTMTFTVTSNDAVFDFTIDLPFQRYNSVYTLDLEMRTITLGKSLTRTGFLISARLFFTILIEGLIFYLFGFRKKASWIFFLLINLLTQGLLNLWLLGDTGYTSYIIFSLIFGEFFVFIAELIGFGVFVEEKSTTERVFYVIIANISSLWLGGYLITQLPL